MNGVNPNMVQNLYMVYTLYIDLILFLSTFYSLIFKNRFTKENDLVVEIYTFSGTK